MIDLSLEVKYFMEMDKDEKVNVAKYLAQHRDVFEILQCMDNSAFSITYYWSGDIDQMLRIFISVSTIDEKDAQQFMTYFKRHFPHLVLDFSNNRSDELEKTIDSFPKIAKMRLKNKGNKFTKNKKLHSLDEMADKLSHWNDSWLLNISLETISIDTKKLQAEQNVNSTFNDLAGSSRLQLMSDNKLKIKENNPLRYQVKFYSGEDINQQSLMILKQGLGVSLKTEKEKSEKSYLERIKSTCLLVKDAHRLFQLPILWKNNLFPVNNIPQFPLPVNMSSQGIQMGIVEGAIKSRPFYLEPDSFQQHCYLVGKTGMGKSTVLGSVVKSLIEQNKQAVFLLDPHGDLAQDILSTISIKDADRVIYIDFGNNDFCPGLNVLQTNDQQALNYVISELDLFFINMYGPEIWGPRISDAFRNLCQLLAHDYSHEKEGTNSATLVDLIWAVDLDNKLIRQRFEKQKNVKNNLMLKIFMDQITKKEKGDGSISELVAYFRAKFSPFIDSPLLRNIIGQQKTTLNFAQMAKERKIVLFNFNKGKIGARQAELLANLITTQIFQVALNNAKYKPEDRIPMTLVGDEFHNYMSESLTTILSEGRKFKLSLVLANQFLTQIQENTRQIGRQKPLLDAILGNVGTLAVFQLSNKDSEIMSAELGKKKVKSEQLASLRQYYAICRNKDQQLFIFKTIALVETASNLQTKQIIKRSIDDYCRARLDVEREINQRLENRLGMVSSTCEDSVRAFRE